MSTTTITTKITMQYLMNKTKSDLADFAYWTTGLLDKEQKEVERLRAERDAYYAVLDQIRTAPGTPQKIANWVNKVLDGDA